MLGAVSLGRKAIGVELKESYFRQAMKNMNIAEDALQQVDLLGSGLSIEDIIDLPGDDDDLAGERLRHHHARRCLSVWAMAREVVTFWLIQRVYCSACRIVRAIVSHPDAEIHCPTCGSPCEGASGPDDIEPDEENAHV